MPVKKETITAAKVMAELAKHEAECNLRYKRIEELLDDQKANMTKLDQMLWLIVVLVIIAPFLQSLL